ncbi:hypothetical protein M409DRAFT_51675 [Zasmidium cellare ATCC 36951]|uniref:Uncharacterized protein n=1 Tax=Zasmidium cellare ATCC 36951 TaxID=1080233 RepID=A0A6A6CXS9_ZASCE|nr:uncharacterized protein M409DRAFT_51675 [Zasmidium cellare ATCC 36951]KAF2170672.1 hypothetical protein M409DRAFT_51675 [Zasmidium cellare ATCC 36951]
MHITAASILQRYDTALPVLQPAPLFISPAKELPSSQPQHLSNGQRPDVQCTKASSEQSPPTSRTQDQSAVQSSEPEESSRGVGAKAEKQPMNNVETIPCSSFLPKMAPHGGSPSLFLASHKNTGVTIHKSSTAQVAVPLVAPSREKLHSSAESKIRASQARPPQSLLAKTPQSNGIVDRPSVPQPRADDLTSGKVPTQPAERRKGSSSDANKDPKDEAVSPTPGPVAPHSRRREPPRTLPTPSQEEVIGCALIGSFGRLGVETHLWEKILMSFNRMDRNALMATNSTMFELISDLMVIITTPRNQGKDDHHRRTIAIGRQLVSYHPTTAIRTPGTYVDAFENSTARTVQIFGYNFWTFREFRDALYAAATEASAKVERLEFVGCIYVDHELLGRLRDLFPWLRHVSIFNCARFDLQWALGAKANEFDDLPFEIDIDFAEPSRDNAALHEYSSPGAVGWTDGTVFNALLQWLITVEGRPLACHQPMMLHHIFLRLNKQYIGLFRTKDLFAMRLGRQPAFPKDLIAAVLCGDTRAKTHLQYSMLRWQSPTRNLSSKDCAGHFNVKQENSLPCGHCNNLSDEEVIEEDSQFYTKHIAMFFSKTTRDRIRKEGPDGDLTCYLGGGMFAAEQFQDDITTAARDDITFSSTALISKVLEMKKTQDSLPNLQRPTPDGLKALKTILQRTSDQKVKILAGNYAWDSQFASHVALSKSSSSAAGLELWRSYLEAKSRASTAQPPRTKESAASTTKAPSQSATRPSALPTTRAPNEPTTKVAAHSTTKAPSEPTTKAAAHSTAKVSNESNTNAPVHSTTKESIMSTTGGPTRQPKGKAPTPSTNDMIPTFIMSKVSTNRPTSRCPPNTQIQVPGSSSAKEPAVETTAEVLRLVCAFNLTGNGPWNPRCTAPCVDEACDSKYHICKTYWSGVKKDGDHTACKHGGEGVLHWDNTCKAQVIHILPSCAFEMPDKTSQGINCKGNCHYGHQKDSTAAAFRVRKSKFAEFRRRRISNYRS